MLYKKAVSMGQFVKKGEDVRQNDIIIIKSEGKPVEGEFGMRDIFLVEIPSGEDKNLTFNKTSVNNMIDAYGEDSVNWVGKEAKIWLVMSNIQGKMKQVLYVSHPDAEIDPETGEFTIIVGSKVGKRIKKEEIPVIEEE